MIDFHRTGNWLAVRHGGGHAERMESRAVTALVGAGDRYLGMVGPFEVQGPWWSYVEGVTETVDRLLGVPTAVVRLLHAGNTELGRGGPVTYHVEAMAPPRAAVLDDRPDADWSEVLADHPLRAWWARPNGPAELVRCATALLGQPLAGTPVQVKTWNLSCLYRLPMAQQVVWGKATAAFAGHEAASIRLVRQHDPGLAPEVLADDRSRRLLLMGNASGVDCWDADVETLCVVVRRWVAVQAAVADGARDGASGLRTWLPASLLADLPALLAGEAGGTLDAAELDAAWRLVDRLPELLCELASAGLPDTLVHGDLHPGNMLSDGVAHMLVDWAESGVGHPAFDAWTLLRWLPAGQRDAVETTWCDAWRSLVPASDPRRALRPTAVLGPLSNAVLYQRFLDNIEPSERVYHEGDPASELRRALSAASDY